jgi:hypothetical protein
LEPDGVEHAGGGLREAWAGGAFYGLPREGFGDQTTEAAEINQMCEFQAVTKGTACGDDGITKPESADGNAQVNISRRTAGVGSA